MAKYDDIQTAAFEPAVEEFTVGRYALNFPKPWRTDVLQLLRAGRPDPDSIQYIYIKALNAAIGAVAPDVLSVASRATADETMPWFYAGQEFPEHVTKALIQSWLFDMRPKDDALTPIRAAWDRLQLNWPQWQEVDVDLLECGISAGGTAVPASHLYRLLPDVLAERIERAKPYTFAGQNVAFRRISSSVSGNGAELMSWPPLRHIQGRGKSQRVWYYSGSITISLRTEPFSLKPRIHITTGIRRWITNGQVVPRGGKAAGVYLSSESPLLDGAPAPERFAYAGLRLTKEGMVWKHGGPSGILSRLSATRHFPSPELLRKEPERFLHGVDGVHAVVVHHTTMGSHGVGTGIMPAERRRLTEWVAGALAPEFRLVPRLTRTTLPRKQQLPARLLIPKKSLTPEIDIKKAKADATPERLAEIKAHNERAERENPAIREANAVIEVQNAQIRADNAEFRRERTTAVVGNRGLSVYLFFQRADSRARVIAAAEASLGLVEYRDEQGPETWTWNGPGLSLRIHARPLGSLGAALLESGIPKKGEEWSRAISKRRSDMASFVNRVAEGTADPAQLAIVEIDGADHFHKRNDPKYPLRLGCADAGLVSQFIAIAGDSDEEQADAVFRTEAAWADSLRQVGARLVPEHTLVEKIPADLNQVGFWLIRRTVAGPTGKQQFTPIAVLLRPGQDQVMGRSPQTDGWVPYPDLLRALTGQVRPEELKTERQQTAATAAFVKQVISEFRPEPTLVVTHAQNTRSRWPWLKNPEIFMDKIGFGEGGLRQRVGLHGRQLRVIRVADGDRTEVPQWWAPDGDVAGVSKGLWLSTNPRVFYSTTDKTSTNHLARDATKLTPKADGSIAPDKQASTPGLLQIAVAALQPEDESPEIWAMFLHQQRFSEDYRDGLALPLVLHLGALATEYAIPHADDDLAGDSDRDDDDEAEDGESESDGSD